MDNETDTHISFGTTLAEKTYHVCSFIREFQKSIKSSEDNLIRICKKYENQMEYQDFLIILLGHDRNSNSVCFNMLVTDEHLFIIIKTLVECWDIDIHFNDELVLRRVLETYRYCVTLQYLLEVCHCDLNKCEKYLTNGAKLLCIQLSPQKIQMLLHHEMNMNFLFDINSGNHIAGLFSNIFFETNKNTFENDLIDILKKLFSKGYQPDNITFISAVDNNFAQIAELLMENGSLPNIDIHVYLDVINKKFQMLKMLLKHNIRIDMERVNKISKYKNNVVNLLRDSGYSDDDVINILLCALREQNFDDLD